MEEFRATQQHCQQCCCFQCPKHVLEDYRSLQTPTEESRGSQSAIATEIHVALKYPTPVSEAKLKEFNFFVADQTPDRYWSNLMRVLRSCEEKWSRDGFDDFIQLRMVEKGPALLGWCAFGAVMCDLYNTASQSQLGGVIQAMYTLMKDKGCTKMCNVMEQVLMEL